MTTIRLVLGLVMKKVHVFFVFCFLVGGQIQAQSDTIPRPGKQHLASIILHVPVGVFSESHFGGIGLNYSWSRNRYGIYESRKGIGFTATGGVDYFLGKKIEVAGHDFKYGGYFYFYAM